MIDRSTVLLSLALLGMTLGAMGCAEWYGVLPGAQEGMKEVERQQILYCGPDGEAMFEKDKREGTFLFAPDHLQSDKLCGKNGIKFKNLSGQSYEKTSLDEVVIYKRINHFKGYDDEIVILDTPQRPYRVIGVMTFPKKWYYSSTIDRYMKEKLSEVGAHAILEYEMFQDGAMMRKSEITGETMHVFRMRMKATLIRFEE